MPKQNDRLTMRISESLKQDLEQLALSMDLTLSKCVIVLLQSAVRQARESGVITETYTVNDMGKPQAAQLNPSKTNKKAPARLAG